MSKSRFTLEIDDIPEKKEIDRKALKQFANGALERDDSLDYNWKHEDPDELPSYNFRLRLNKYQIGLLKYVAKSERRSLSNMIRVILIDELLKRVKQ